MPAAVLPTAKSLTVFSLKPQSDRLLAKFETAGWTSGAGWMIYKLTTGFGLTTSAAALDASAAALAGIFEASMKIY